MYKNIQLTGISTLISMLFVVVIIFVCYLFAIFNFSILKKIVFIR